MKGGQHLKASHPPSAQEQPRPAKKRAGREQLELAWEQHAARHTASSAGPSPLQQVERYEVEYIDLHHCFSLTVWSGCKEWANPLHFFCWPRSQIQ
ncbi:hypothetical protein HaLaN_28299, partial [Haematococcus lacustris]